MADELLRCFYDAAASPAEPCPPEPQSHIVENSDGSVWFVESIATCNPSDGTFTQTWSPRVPYGLAAHAGNTLPAVRQAVRHSVVAIDLAGTIAELLYDFLAQFQVLGPNTGAKPVVRVIGITSAFLFS